jgi:hypothetical protein
MIPDLDSKGMLPRGIHKATLDELRKRFATSTRREKLFDGLIEALRNMKGAGVERVYIDGSFVTNKVSPNDIDGCWEAHPRIDVKKLDPVLLDFSNRRAAMKSRYGIDFFISQNIEASSGVPFVEFFQTDRDGNPRGIVLVDLTKESLQ